MDRRTAQKRFVFALFLLGGLSAVPSVQPSPLLLASDVGDSHENYSLNPAEVVEPEADSSSTAENKSTTTIFDPNSGETETLLEANRRAARDNLFVKYLLLSCATIGAIIAFVVWRSMPPKPKANTEGN